MADLFVSYKSEDRARVAPLVAALEADGVVLWWDAYIGGGSEWREAIELELGAARCVLVVWSEHSTGPGGSFVRDEATRALRRGAYLPVRIDPVEPPLGFGETQALSLIGWRGDGADTRYLALLAAIQSAIIGGPRPIAITHQPAVGVGRRVVMGGSVAAVMATGAGGWWEWRRRESVASDSVAVMPFGNLSGDPSQAYFSDGIAEELRDVLTRVARLKVAARTSSELMRGVDVTTAAARLGVAKIVTGTVRRGTGTIRIDAQLIDGKTGLTQWSQVYDRAIGDALEIETSIAESVAGSLEIVLGRVEKRLLSSGGTTNPAAQDAYLRGAAFDAQNRSVEAADEYDKAIAADPSYALAHAAAVITKANLASFSFDAAALRVALAHLKTEAHRAMALAPGLARPITSLGFVLECQLDLRGAAATYAKAFQAARGTPSIIKAFFDARFGDEGAYDVMTRALALDPLRPNGPLLMGRVLLHLGRFNDAIAELQAGLIRLPADANGRSDLATALLAKGRNKEALTAAARLPADNYNRLVIEAAVTAKMDRPSSDRALVRLMRLMGDTGQYQYAEVHAQRGEPDLAFAAIKRGWDFIDPGLLGLKVDPLLAPLHSDPRFGMWLRKIGFS